MNDKFLKIEQKITELPQHEAALKKNTMKYILLTFFFLIMTFVIAQGLIAKNTSNTGQIPYNTLATFENFEIRLYPELTVASTALPQSGYSENSRLGFRKIAGYIFGGNSTNTQISMTSPVQMKMDNEESMSFYMPPTMNIKDLPTPNNAQILVEQQPSKTVAVIRFSGWASDQILEKKYQELKCLLEANNIEFQDGYEYLGYNPPYQLINRINEVTIDLVDYSI